MSAQDEVNLGNLPSDVIRKIIAVGFDSIHDMKLINRRWNSLALDHLIRRPVIKRVECAWNRGEKFTIGFEFPLGHKKYFGMQNQSSPPVRVGFPKLPDSEDSCEFNVDTVQLMQEEGNDIDFMRRVFDRCSAVEFLQITTYIFVGGLYIKPIKRVTGRLKIDELKLAGQYCKDETQEIINLLKYNTVRLLSLSLFDIEFVKKSGTFFSEAASLVSTIKFYRGIYLWADEERGKLRIIWKEATDWLNENGKITATLQEKQIGDTFMMICITVESKQ